MIRDSDAAMYRAKTTGRNRYEVFDTEMHDEAINLLRLESDLEHAIKRNEFMLQYQPVFAVADRRLSGLEALVRWVHPDRGMLLPQEVIEAAEDTGLIVPLGWWVLRQACTQMKAWQEAYGDATREITMSVNLSGRQFLQGDLVTRIEGILRDSELAPASLRLEISEMDVMRNADAAVNVL